MRIGIIGAMSEEIQACMQVLETPQSQLMAGMEFFSGRITGKEVILVSAGIGKVNAAVAITLLHNTFHCDAVINVGIAGGLQSHLKVGDVVISSELSYYDVDATVFGYAFGQVPRMPVFYKADGGLMHLARQAAQNVKEVSAYEGLMLSGDSFMHKAKCLAAVRQQFPEAYTVEMEACAVAQACYLLQMPFVAIRGISDAADHTSHLDSETFLHLAAENASKIVLAMLTL